VFCWSFVSPFVSLLPDALRTELRATLRLAGPVVAAQLAHISIGFVDTVMVGRLGPDALAVQLLGVAAVFQLFDGLQVAAHGALQGLKDTRVSMGIAMGTYWGIGLTTGYLWGVRRGGGPEALWWAWWSASQQQPCCCFCDFTGRWGGPFARRGPYPRRRRPSRRPRRRPRWRSRRSLLIRSCQSER
jgi:hypothetical protein